jgi:hypothetical protein
VSGFGPEALQGGGLRPVRAVCAYTIEVIRSAHVLGDFACGGRHAFAQLGAVYERLVLVCLCLGAWLRRRRRVANMISAPPAGEASVVAELFVSRSGHWMRCGMASGARVWQICFLLCLLGCCSFNLRAAPDGREAGQAVGANVREAAVRTGARKVLALLRGRRLHFCRFAG